ncbi:hypothetical protein F4677DRAFT_318532 [Hypoxylon crocopeplum]|nr:hypothetical protein F4677DRAFT_318532 [Hypoxylon crocopeplum]
MMLFGILLFLSISTGTFQTEVRFTTSDWEIQLGKPLSLEWANADGAVSISLVRITARGPAQTNEIVKDHTGSDTFTWIPRDDLAPGDYVLRIDDRWSSDDSPRLAVPGHSLQQVYASRDTGDTNGNEQGGQGYSPGVVTGIGVGSTLGGVILLGLVAFLVYRGRQKNRARIDDQGVGKQDKGKGKQKELQLNVQGAIERAG